MVHLLSLSINIYYNTRPINIYNLWLIKQETSLFLIKYFCIG